MIEEITKDDNACMSYLRMCNEDSYENKTDKRSSTDGHFLKRTREEKSNMRRRDLEGSFCVPPSTMLPSFLLTPEPKTNVVLQPHVLENEYNYFSNLAESVCREEIAERFDQIRVYDLLEFGLLEWEMSLLLEAFESKRKPRHFNADTGEGGEGGAQSIIFVLKVSGVSKS